MPGSNTLPAKVERVFNIKAERVLHPFSPLTEQEIKTAAALTRKEHPDVDLHFKCVTLREPEKEVMKKWLTEAEDSKPKIVRKAFVVFYFRRTPDLFEYVINLATEAIESKNKLDGFHSCADGEEILQIEQVCLEDEGVKAEIAKLQLPEGTVVLSDPWIYGSDGVNDERKQWQCYLYTRPKDNADSNHYASPIPISPVVDVATMKVVRIDRLPLGVDEKIEEHKPYVPSLNEYLPEHQKLRTDLKPINIIQPEGVSFRFSKSGEEIEWQKWKFRVGFNYREGMVLYNVSYDGRDLFYRLSLSDMAIPYADPRKPYHRKQAFDLGDAGAGVMANNLKLGCDCLGTIAYLSFPVADDKGEPMVMENCICVHEQDAGIQFKHMNYRTGRSVLSRMRELVLQSIITVANYEYIFAFIFNTAGEVSYEVRATGILSTAPIDQSIKDSPNFGTIVHPGVLAQHHQHIFSLRIDPAIDGFGNKVIYEEAQAMDPKDPSNPFGTGYYISETSVDTEAGFLEAPQNNRVFKIQNPKNRNPINNKAVGYKIQAPPFQKLLASEGSYHFKRAEFADKAVYVTKYNDWEYFAAGQYTNQSRGGHGVREWCKRETKLDVEQGDDVVVWVQFGINHIPRIEDFPVMPVETVRVHLKPVNFFDKNPALDLPPSTQEINKSILVSANGGSHNQGGGVEADIGENGQVSNVHPAESAGACCK
ncbi:hypothetical protein H072_166 [Dactylellina haptotyla CBS 200.50]|uniref:Amine oxidase n=1 Tax=Dactylellina haptotyla (strain CBS 200.50) TaxID=1284197 RepID=S8ASC3_DACHA|nr:hypothetical protein H072_166 [Dactylellina haptotyla CBS 200.50]